MLFHYCLHRNDELSEICLLQEFDELIYVSNIGKITTVKNKELTLFLFKYPNYIRQNIKFTRPIENTFE